MSNRKKWVLILFAMAALLQLAVPGYMIYRQEVILQRGRVYKFRTALVDPADPFRGRYVRLGFNLSVSRSGKEIPYGKTVNAVPAVGADGFAYIAAVVDIPPDDGIYFPVKVGWSSNKDTMSVNPPFDRFYLNEAAAPEAERLYMEASRKNSAWIEVRVRDGNAAIADLYLDGRPIRELTGRKK